MKFFKFIKRIFFGSFNHRLTSVQSTFVQAKKDAIKLANEIQQDMDDKKKKMDKLEQERQQLLATKESTLKFADNLSKFV